MVRSKHAKTTGIKGGDWESDIANAIHQKARRYAKDQVAAMIPYIMLACAVLFLASFMFTFYLHTRFMSKPDRQNARSYVTWLNWYIKMPVFTSSKAKAVAQNIKTALMNNDYVKAKRIHIEEKFAELTNVFTAFMDVFASKADHDIGMIDEGLDDIHAPITQEVDMSLQDQG